jgi:hypothetical protein
MVSDFDTGISHIKKPAHERKILADSSLAYNISVHSHIFKNFKRFVKYENEKYIMKTLDEIKAEMPKPKEKKKKDKDDDKIDLSMLKITDQ